MARHSKEQAEQTRETLIDAAEQVFFRRGVARASLEEVARAAGVTRGAVYWHFRDKLDLFLAIEERVRLPHETMVAELTRSAPSGALAALEALEASVTATFRAYDVGDRKRVQLTVLLLRCDYIDEMAPALDRQAAMYRRLASAMRGYFRDAVGLPAAGCDWDPEIAAHVFYTLVHGAIMRWLRDPADFALSSSGVRAVSGFLTALRKGWCRDGPIIHENLKDTYTDECVMKPQLDAGVSVGQRDSR